MRGRKTSEQPSAEKSNSFKSSNNGDLENQLRQARRAGKGKGSDGGEDDTSSQSSVITTYGHRRTAFMLTFSIVILGAVAGSVLIGIGVKNANQDVHDQFDRRAKDLVTRIGRAWDDYVNAAAWIHGRCRSRNFTRFDFRETYEYLINSGLDFQAAQFDPNITNEQRPAAEEEARKFYAKYYPDYQYRGFIGFNYDNSTELEPRNIAPFYFPIHYMEPVIGNEKAIDLDYHASGSRKRTVMYCIDNGKPALTDRLQLVQETTPGAFGVVLMHPGYNLTTDTEGSWPRDLASIVVRIPDLLRRSAKDQGETSAAYIFDASDSGGYPLFLGAAKIDSRKSGPTELTFLPEATIDEIEAGDYLQYKETVEAAQKEWIVLVHALEGTYKPDLAFVIMGGAIIVAASICLAFWVYNNYKRTDMMNKMRAAADAEKAALVLDNARQATRAERELNDFIAHEVRNPVAAAMSACSFVKSAVNEREPLSTPEQQKETQEDVEIIDNALRFVNDLLRNMLDMHRAANKQLKVNMTPTVILHDVLEPVQAMLPQRNTTFKVLAECDDSLVTMTDRLRLKQVCLNLGRNSVKFIDEGFIRLRSDVINGEVHLYIEDSGPGIPVEKRQMLFSKFQESLDSLSQGTGIGLFLCKNLVELMEGEIWLDEEYDSGIPGYPGTRFVINLKQPPIDPQFINEFHSHETANGTGETAPMDFDDEEESIPVELPECISVLFVDDDPILRKLFSRTVRIVAPGWKIREASNGETACRLVDEEKFDLIFMDMYMASVEKQMLGTETVRALRNKGVDCRICGLSANDKETEFLEAGADVFTFKPFPCEATALTNELVRVLYRDDKPAD